MTVGPHQSGKSTLFGRFIYELGGIDQRTIARFESVSVEMGQSGSKFAWVLDKLRTERERGMSLDLSVWSVETRNFRIALFDTPGHRNCIKTTIRGLSLADVAVVVVDASGKEAAFSRSSVLYDQLLCLRAFEVTSLIFCVTKMDIVDFPQGRFEKTCDAVRKLCSFVGFSKEMLGRCPFVPLSGWEGQNLIQASSQMPWWSGPTLLDAVDGVRFEERQGGGPFRFPIYDVFHIGGIGTVVVGKTCSGVATPGMAYSVGRELSVDLPPIADIRSIERFHRAMENAPLGMNAGLCLRGISANVLRRGDVIGDPGNNPPHSALSFQARLIFVDPLLSGLKTIRRGFTPVVDVGAAHVPCRLNTIHPSDRSDDGAEGDLVSFPNERDAMYVATMTPLRPLVVELESICPELGRIILRDRNRIVATGTVIDVQTVE